MDLDSIYRNVLLITCPEVHRTVDSCSGIPAAVWLVRIPCDHADFILCFVFQKSFRIYIEICITIWSVCGFLSINIDFCIMINTFKLNENFFAAVLWRHKNMFRIFIIAAQIPAGVSLTDAFCSTRFTPHGIMWKCYGIWFFISGQASASPVSVKIYLLHFKSSPFLFLLWPEKFFLHRVPELHLLHLQSLPDILHPRPAGPSRHFPQEVYSPGL